jgi:hypothetical protein
MINDIASVVAIASIVAFLPVALVSTLSLRSVFIYLQASHPDIWQELGQPSMWRGQWSATSPASKFITSQLYRGTPDPELWRRCQRCRLASNILLALFIVFLFSFLLLSVNK